MNIRIAIAKDEAFNFYYQDNLDLLEELGAELIYFSPIYDNALPDGVGGIYIGGGFPEIYPDKLEANTSMRQSIQKAAEYGIIIYAECGGMMYLLDELITLDGHSHRMCGVLKGSSRMEAKRQGLGYITVKASIDNILCKKGDTFRAHEFHYSSLLNLPQDTCYAYEVSKKDGGLSKCDGICTNNILASYTHVHFASKPVLAKNLLNNCAKSPTPFNKGGQGGIDEVNMKTGVIVLAHGSKANGGNDGLFKIVEMLQNMGKWDIVRAGFLQFAQPTFTQSVKNIVEEGAQRVVILPLLLFAGNHVRKDIPMEIEAERQKHPHVEFLYARNLGADERIAHIAADRINEALIPLFPPLVKGNNSSYIPPLKKGGEGGFESPQAILKESFRIIDELVNLSNFDEPCRQIVRRVIHASGDPEYARSLIIHPCAVEAGVNAIRVGKHIVTDVNMVKAGISKKAVERFGGNIVCKVADSEIRASANASGKTRALTAIQRSIEEMAGGIVAIGNAPTALFEIINLVNEGKANPALIIGVPVGFVGAAEAKEALRGVSTTYITNVGRKGGSAIAVAITNALIEIAKKL